MESSGCLSFVDVLMSCQPNLGAQTEYSHWPLLGLWLPPSAVSHEISSSTLMNRTHTHSSTTSLTRRLSMHVGRTLRMNGYPSRLTKEGPDEIIQTLQLYPLLTSPPNGKHHSYPIHQRSLRVHQDLISLGHPSMLQMIPDRQTKFLKDPVPDLQRWDVVYKTPCATCNSSYIGQTGSCPGDSRWA